MFPRSTYNFFNESCLVNVIQDKATTGKKGLGRGDQPKKVGGAHWKGQKKAFDSSSEDEDEDEVEEEEEEEEESEVDQGTSSVDADGEGNLKKRKYGNVSACDRDNADAQENVAVIKATKKQKADTENKDVSDIVHLIAETPNEEKLEIIPSWRKLCKQVLTEVTHLISFQTQAVSGYIPLLPLMKHANVCDKNLTYRIQLLLMVT